MIYLKKYKMDYICIFIIVLLSFVFLYFFFDLSQMDINVPLFYNGDDSFMGLSSTKMLKDGNSILVSDYMGAPFGTERYDYYSLLTYNFDNLITKMLVSITNNAGMTYNIQYLLLFPFIAIISFLVMRNLNICYYISVFGSLTFSFLPFIFLRNQAHIVLSQYQFIPLSILLCIWLYNDDELFNIKKFFKYKRNLITLLFLLLITNNGIAYYPFFTCFFLIITGLSKSLKNKKFKGIKQSLSMIAIIVTILIINLLPSLYYTMKNGTNEVVAHRSKIEAEIYGLKITQFFLPNKSLGISKIDDLITYYGNNAPLPNEGSEHLGVIGCIGLIILLLSIFIKSFNEKKDLEQIKLLSELNIFAILLGTIGGLGSIFSLGISSSIRAYNRISIFIAFICILTVCLILNYIYKKHLKPFIFYPIVTLIFLFSIYEQYPDIKPNYKYAKETFYSDKNFIKDIETSVSSNAMIFQLPYHQYPESGPVNAMNDYHLFTGYIHSKNLKWSYGGMKGRISDLWNQKISSLDIQSMVKYISIVGFEGIYIDKRAYTIEDYTQLENELMNILDTEPIYSENEQLCFFNMRDFNKEYYSMYEEDEISKLKEKILNMNYIKLGKGFSGIEGDRPNQWMWTSNDAELIIFNSSPEKRQFNMNFYISSSTDQKSSLNIRVNDTEFNYYIDLNGIRIDEMIILNPGENIIRISTNAPQVYAPQDPRELYLRITDFYNMYDDDILIK
ncbi:hypothetical protein H0486_08145 [Lachnospiraceae bacterium MD1]|uniref:Sugar translocase n=1 Tax=Variimorphobacter saccharofermentans TaxID=2755051 RepID=A0A839JZN3_9FIRM|nr:hypothetical protein [Variimorphobacter saccharofermentans]MBB2182844.1 hypothetical protein [Variimorphobacter saccharofermentans]